jgi:SAM-dependent methyltransferase
MWRGTIEIMAKLNIGCGGQVIGMIEGLNQPEYDWINMDYRFTDEFLNHPKAKDLIDGFPRVMEHDMTKPLPFVDGFAEAIFTCHALEHIPTASVVPVLTEWCRVLKSGAKAVIIVPDLLGIAKKLVETDGDLEWSQMGERTGDYAGGYTKLLTGIFGDESGPGMFHYTGFTPKHITRVLQRAGFGDVAVRDLWNHEIYSIEATATRP